MYSTSCFVFSLISFLLFLSSCGNSASDKETENPKIDSTHINKSHYGIAKIIEPEQDEEIVVLENEGITLTEIKTSSSEKISLELETKIFKEGLNELKFLVKGMDDYSIAIIENNYSVSHHQSNKITKEFLYGNNVFLAFLTHKNNIAVKTNNALHLQNVLINDEDLFNMNQPHLFYYLPQEKTSEPILDFCLVNTSISESGNKIKVTINGTEFILNKWTAYKIEGLEETKNTIRIQLLDASGNLIDGPFNDSGDRNFNIEKRVS